MGTALTYILTNGEHLTSVGSLSLRPLYVNADTSRGWDTSASPTLRGMVADRLLSDVACSPSVTCFMWCSPCGTLNGKSHVESSTVETLRDISAPLPPWRHSQMLRLRPLTCVTVAPFHSNVPCFVTWVLHHISTGSRQLAVRHLLQFSIRIYRESDVLVMSYDDDSLWPPYFVT